MAVSLSRFPIGSGICDIPYRLCTCGKYLPIPGCIRRLLAVPAVSSLGSPVKDTDICWCYISSRPVYQVPFNVRQPQPKFFARCLVLVYFIYFPCVIKFSVLNIQKFSCQYTINTSTIEKITIFTSFFLFEIVSLLWYTAYFPFLAVILASKSVSPKKGIPVPLYSKKCVRGLIFE